MPPRLPARCWACNIVNTTMLGAVIKVTGVINKKSTHDPLQKRFGKLGERNIKAMETAYEQVVC